MECDIVPLKISHRELPDSKKISGAISVQSDKYMVVRETGSDVVIVDLENHQIQKLPFSQNHVISALMNPTMNIIAIQYKTCLKICNTETKGWSKSIDISSDNVLFLKWVNSAVFCYVTATSIYYWKISDNSNPTKAYDLPINKVPKSRIVDYRAQGEDLFLLGLKDVEVDDSNQNAIPSGTLLLYCVGKNISQEIVGTTAACFLSFKIKGNPHFSNLFCFVMPQKDRNWKFYIVETHTTEGNSQYRKKVFLVDFGSNYDYPFAIEASSRYGIVYLLTKKGCLLIFEVEEGVMLYRLQNIFATNNVTTGFTEEICIAMELFGPAGGILAISLASQIIKVTIDEKLMVNYVKEKLQNPKLASLLADRAKQSVLSESDLSSFVTPRSYTYNRLSVAMPTPMTTEHLQSPQSSQIKPQITPLKNLAIGGKLENVTQRAKPAVPSPGKLMSKIKQDIDLAKTESNTPETIIKEFMPEKLEQVVPPLNTATVVQPGSSAAMATTLGNPVESKSEHHEAPLITLEEPTPADLDRASGVTLRQQPGNGNDFFREPPEFQRFQVQGPSKSPAAEVQLPVGNDSNGLIGNDSGFQRFGGPIKFPAAAAQLPVAPTIEVHGSNGTQVGTNGTQGVRSYKRAREVEKLKKVLSKLAMPSTVITDTDSGDFVIVPKNISMHISKSESGNEILIRCVIAESGVHHLHTAEFIFDCDRDEAGELKLEACCRYEKIRRDISQWLESAV